MMKYAVLGAGAMGSIIGATLSKGGQEVVLIDPYQEHMDKVKREGLKLTFGQTTETIRMQVCTNPADAGQVDIVVLLVKSFLSEEALKGALGLFGERTCICTLQNGLGNNELLERLFPRDRVLQGVIHLTGQMIGAGEVTGDKYWTSDIYLGSLVKEGYAVETAQAMVKHLTDGGLKTKYKIDIEKDIWEKAVINTCLNAPCGILRIKVGDYFSHPEGKRLVQDIAKEFTAVAAAKGIAVDYDAAIKCMEIGTKARSEHYPSMAQDMKNRRKTEIDSLNGAIARYGRQLGVPTPANDYITRFVKMIQDNYDAQF